jgi:hypothetical protein
MHQQIGTSIGSQGALSGALTLIRCHPDMFRGTWIGWMKTFPEFLVKNLVLSTLRGIGGGSGTEPSLGGLLPRVLASTISARLITYPFEVCKLRAMQYEGLKPYTGLYDTGRRIIIEEGFLALFKGLPIALAANVVYSITMSIVSPWTHSLASQFNIPTWLSMHVSRLISMFTSYPFETVKRRIASKCDWVPATSLPPYSSSDATALQLLKHMFYNNWTQLWAGFPLMAISHISKSLIVSASQGYSNQFFMWNNGYTASIFDTTPLPGISHDIDPNTLHFRKRVDNRI